MLGCCNEQVCPLGGALVVWLQVWVQKQHRLIKPVPIQDLPADNILQSCDDEERLQQVSGDEDLMISQSLIFLPNVGAPPVVPTVTCSQVSSVILFQCSLKPNVQWVRDGRAHTWICSNRLSTCAAALTSNMRFTLWCTASSQAWVCLERSAEVSPRLRD